jgi:hypothetical protein
MRRSVDDPVDVTDGAPAEHRERFLDRLRGLAMLLMLLDHGLLLWLELQPGEDLRGWLRRSVTRFSMPLFMLVSGYLLERTSRRRMFEVAGVALVLNGALVVLWPAFLLPEILAVWVFLLPIRGFLLRFPVEAAALGVLQAMYLPVRWPGYEPGVVLLFLALGRIWSTRPDRHRETLVPIGERIPSWVGRLGRRPLGVYAAHLLALAVAARLLVP